VRYANARLGLLLAADVSRWPGRDCAELLGPLLTPIRSKGALFDGELWAVSGARRVLRRFVDTIGGGTGAPSGTIEVYSDVTSIHEIDRLKDDFIAAAAHDLKTPVTAVKGYTQIALRLARRASDVKLLQQLEMINAR
jgi:two-component system, OmpR family, phosphate regulon sensor histidine kinase PhoR